MSLNSKWDIVIGLEVHAQLKTQSKIFSSDSAEFHGGDNEHISSVSLALPGSLPVLNQEVVRQGVLAGLALGCEISETSIFSRKNYFYPDLPKGYQISQYDQPLCREGDLTFFVDEEERRVRIERAHLEEDAGKSIHHGTYSLINFNRAGVPLLEIVSAPVMSSPHEAAEYVKEVRRRLMYVGVSDGNLEEGSLRCDCNISLKKKGEAQLGTKVEIKNLNSFRFIEKALEYEIHRQADLLDSGGVIEQETRLYDSTKNKTYTMRSKEEAQDYRYFPDPDILPLHITKEAVENLKDNLPEFSFEKQKRWMAMGLSKDDASLLSEEKDLADYFEKVFSVSQNLRSSAAWVVNEILRDLKENKLNPTESLLSPENLGALIQSVDQKVLSAKMAKQVYLEMWKNPGKSPAECVQELGLEQVTDEAPLRAMVEEILNEFPDQVAQYKSGKEKLFSFFVGQVMKKTKGQANPEILNQLLKECLKRSTSS